VQVLGSPRERFQLGNGEKRGQIIKTKHRLNKNNEFVLCEGGSYHLVPIS
jgi:hypothetical protein